MKIFYLLCLLGFLSTNVHAQTTRELQETAKVFMKQGDFQNALLVLNRAHHQEPDDPSVRKDLALVNYYLKDFNKAYDAISPVIDGNQSDDQSFQIAANIQRSLRNLKEADKIYKKGLKKFPSSGALYNDYGELLWLQKDYNAIAQWEKGIASDPAFPRNYYNAALFHYFTTDKTWSLIYGEIYLNMEPYGSSAPEVKEILLEGYKKLFTDTDLLKNSKGTSPFNTAYLTVLNAQGSLTSQGINAEVLTMVRTRFILEWFDNYNTQFPFRLFEYHQQLIREGMFNAYNQWIFGAAQNLQQYTRWISLHSEEAETFTRFQRSRVFKMPENQYYK